VKGEERKEQMIDLRHVSLERERAEGEKIGAIRTIRDKRARDG
jgi:hypothetical protein